MTQEAMITEPQAVSNKRARSEDLEVEGTAIPNSEDGLEPAARVTGEEPMEVDGLAESNVGIQIMGLAAIQQREGVQHSEPTGASDVTDSTSTGQAPVPMHDAVSESNVNGKSNGSAVRDRRASGAAVTAREDQLRAVMRKITEGAALQLSFAEEAAELLRGTQLSAASVSQDPFLKTYADFIAVSVAQMDSEGRKHWEDYLLKTALHWFELVLPQPKPESFADLTETLRKKFPPAKDLAEEAIKRIKSCALVDNMTAFVDEFNADVNLLVQQNGKQVDGDETSASPLSETQLCDCFLDGLGRQPAYGIRLRDMVVARHDPFQPMTLTAIQDLAVVYYSRMGLDAVTVKITNPVAEKRTVLTTDEAPRKIRAISRDELSADRTPAARAATKPEPPKFGRYCRHCNRTNHASADCRNAPKRSAESGPYIHESRAAHLSSRKSDQVAGPPISDVPPPPPSSSSSTRCENCGRNDHSTSQCHLPRLDHPLSDNRVREDRSRSRSRVSINSRLQSAPHHPKRPSSASMSTGASCHICKRTGHTAETCRHAHGNGGDVPVCANCNIKGHTVRTCHKLGRYAPGDPRGDRGTGGDRR
ncbi:hypothetical protein HKX48_002898 [Thoreauomyces humboldtii]|nr:hypothetical protein HKX48_002898 [Thoreauomyces humboldtii]